MPFVAIAGTFHAGIASRGSGNPVPDAATEAAFANAQAAVDALA